GAFLPSLESGRLPLESFKVKSSLAAFSVTLAPVSRVVLKGRRNRDPAMKRAVRFAKQQQDTPKGNLMETNHTAVRKEITERLTRSWSFTDQQLSDLSVFHLLTLLMLLAGPYGYIGQFAPTVCALRETLGEDLVFDKPSELRAKQTVVDVVQVAVVN